MLEVTCGTDQDTKFVAAARLGENCSMSRGLLCHSEVTP
jgi:hypothetical protein